MTRLRALWLIAGGLAVATAICAACGFPDVEFAPESGGLDGNFVETGTSDGSSTDGSANDAAKDATIADGFNADVILDANPDVAVAEDAGTKVDAAGCKPTDCDCDHDGYDDIAKPTCPNPTDCDDTDQRAHPNQLFLEADAEPPLNGDWNCNKTVEKGYQEKLSCENLLLGIGCTDVFGYTGTVECGHTGKFVRCKQVPVIALPLACGVDSDSIDNTKIQPCK